MIILKIRQISWIEKNTFYGTKNVHLLALYGNPLIELGPSSLNNLHNVRDIRLPLGIQHIVPGAFYGLSDVHDLVLEGLQGVHIQADTFFNLSNVQHLTIHDSDLVDMSPRAFGENSRRELLISMKKRSNVSIKVINDARVFQVSQSSSIDNISTLNS